MKLMGAMHHKAQGDQCYHCKETRILSNALKAVEKYLEETNVNQKSERDEVKYCRDVFEYHHEKGARQKSIKLQEYWYPLQKIAQEAC